VDELQEVLRINASILVLVARATIVYWSIFLMFRIAGRRHISEMGFADLIVIMIVAESVGDSLGGGEETIFDGVIVAATVVAWSVTTDRLCFWFPAISRFIEPTRICLVKNGQVQRRNMRREFITDDELQEQLHRNGLMAITDVNMAYLEPNGEITVVPIKDR